MTKEIIINLLVSITTKNISEEQRRAIYEAIDILENMNDENEDT